MVRPISFNFQGWKSREIIRLKPPEGCEEIAIDVYFMEDARTVLQKLLKKEEARGMKFQFKEERVQKEDHADFNQRIFGELYMGDRMKELEVSIVLVWSIKENATRSVCFTDTGEP